MRPFNHHLLCCIVIQFCVIYSFISFSSRAGMHPEKERRSHTNGGTKSKHKSKSSLKSSFNSLLNNNRQPFLDRNLNCSDPYMGPSPAYSPLLGMDPLAARRGLYMSPCVYGEPPYHPGLPGTEPASLPVYPWTLGTSRPRPRVQSWDVWASPYAPAASHHNEFARPFAMNTGNSHYTIVCHHRGSIVMSLHGNLPSLTLNSGQPWLLEIVTVKKKKCHLFCDESYCIHLPVGVHKYAC